MKSIKDIMYINEATAAQDKALLQKSKIDFDLEIEGLALGTYKTFGVIINMFGGNDYEATISKNGSERHVASLENYSSLKQLLADVMSKVK